MKLKKAAQRAAKELGVPLSIIVNTSLRSFIRNPRMETVPLIPSKRLRKAIKEAEREHAQGKAKVFNSAEELIADLHS